MIFTSIPIDSVILLIDLRYIGLLELEEDFLSSLSYAISSSSFTGCNFFSPSINLVKSSGTGISLKLYARGFKFLGVIPPFFIMIQNNF